MIVKPDYESGSIVNLMSSIAARFGFQTPYSELDILSSAELAGGQNIVNFVIDGLGYEYLAKYCKESLMYKNLKGKLTSVFPSTTASCITSFATGLSTREHGVTGWFMRLKNSSDQFIPSIPLFYRSRGDKRDLRDLGVDPSYVFPEKSLVSSLNGNLFTVLPKEIIDSVYTSSILAGAETEAYSDLDSFFKVTEDVIKREDPNKKGKYIYSYFPGFDTLCHQVGEKSAKLQDLFKLLDKALAEFLKSIEGTDTIVILTADHGLITTEDSQKRINLNDYPQINNLLSFPLCGEPRAAYCYVKEDCKDEFVQNVQNELGHACDVVKSTDLVEQGYFGKNSSSSDFDNRIGDFVLLMKDKYIIKDFIDGEDVQFHLANHGGLSEKEIYIPLCVFDRI